MEYLQKNYADSSLCAMVMADEFRVSEKYLFTLFKKKTGHSPIRYLHSIRMKRAAELLCEDKMTVQQVCEAVGIPKSGDVPEGIQTGIRRRPQPLPGIRPPLFPLSFH